MSLPPWIRESTSPRRDEVERVASELDPRLAAVARDATAPAPAEVARLRSRLPSARRGWSPAWLGAPALVALAVLTARWVGPTELPVGPITPGDGLHHVSADSRVELVPGVWAEGRGTADLRDGVATLDGILRIEATAPFEFVVAGVRFATDAAAFHVADGELAVVTGVVRGADGARLTAGDTWPLVVAAVEVRPEPSRELIAGPDHARAPAPSAPALPESHRRGMPSATPLPESVVAWRDLLDARDAGATGPRFARMLESYRTRFPDSPFAPEAADLAALEAVRSSPPDEALRGVEARLAASPGSGRALDLHAAAAFLARESLQDCGRAAPHDAWLAEHARGRPQATARAMLGLCAAQEGRADDAQAAWRGLDESLLDPAVAAAVSLARATGGGAP